MLVDLLYEILWLLFVVMLVLYELVLYALAAVVRVVDYSFYFVSEYVIPAVRRWFYD